MTASGHSLPVEVWLNIFDRIQDKRQLVQCKQVCKRWASLVEMAMLKTVVLTQKNTSKLYQYLRNHPKSRPCVQVINISDYSFEGLADISALLSVAITPSLRAIHGSVWTFDFIDTIANAVASYPADSLKLEEVPGTALSNDGYVSLVYLLRKTLRFLHLALVHETKQEYITKICDNLNEFESLADLRLMDLKTYINSIPKLDEMLRGCPRLQSLLLMVDQSPIRTATDNLDVWLSQNVQKVDSMRSITIKNTPLGYREGEIRDLSSGFNVDLLRYLSFKYPQVQHVHMEFYQQEYQPIVGSLFENAETVTLQKWEIDTIDHAEQIMDVWKSQNNSVAIEYKPFILATDSSCHMDVNKVKETDHTKFTLRNIVLRVPLERIQQLLSSLENTLTKGFKIDLVNYQNNLQHATPLTFLQSTPFIQHLKVRSNNLDYDFPLAPLTRLHTLELEDICLAAEDIAAIASWAPHLEYLTLTSCRFTTGNRYESQSMNQEILLPQVALSTLTIKGKGMRTQDMYISLAMPTSSQSHLLYTAPSRPLVQTTFEESMLYFSETTALSIECKSLKHLSVSLDHINVELEFDEEGNIIESYPDIINSEAIDMSNDIAWLKTENQALAAKYEQAKKYLTEAQIQAIEKQDM